MLNVLAVETPTYNPFTDVSPASACVMKENSVFIYTPYAELIPVGTYSSYLGNIKHAVREQKYEWADFVARDGDRFTRCCGEIFINGIETEPFKEAAASRKKISDATLKIFNTFLQIVNKDTSDMINSLKLSWKGGYFRKNVEEIVSEDEVGSLSGLDRETIVRCRYEGIGFIRDYTKEQLNTTKSDRFIDINYFFRRVFVLEAYNYVSFEEPPE